MNIKFENRTVEVYDDVKIYLDTILDFIENCNDNELRKIELEVLKALGESSESELEEVESYIDDKIRNKHCIYLTIDEDLDGSFEIDLEDVENYIYACSVEDANEIAKFLGLEKNNGTLYDAMKNEILNEMFQRFDLNKLQEILDANK